MAQTQQRGLRVLIVDERALMRSGLHAALADDDSVAVVDQAASLDSAVTLLESTDFDVVIASFAGLDAIATNGAYCMLAQRAGGAQLICLSRNHFDPPPRCGRFAALPESTPPERILAQLHKEPDASVFSCSADQLCDARHTHLSVGPSLTAQEGRVLSLLTDGLSNRQIAQSLGLAEKTVKNYVTRVLAKLGVSNRAAAIAIRHSELGRELHQVHRHRPE